MISFGKLFGIGCGDNSCVWGSRGGMATNGGCRCYDKNFHFEIKDADKRLEAQMKSMRELMELKQGIRLLREIAEIPKLQMALKELVEKMK